MSRIKFIYFLVMFFSSGCAVGKGEQGGQGCNLSAISGIYQLSANTKSISAHLPGARDIRRQEKLIIHKEYAEFLGINSTHPSYDFKETAAPKADHDIDPRDSVIRYGVDTNRKNICRVQMHLSNDSVWEFERGSSEELYFMYNGYIHTFLKSKHLNP